MRTAPFHLKSNGKLERLHQSLKGECIRPKSPVSLADVRRLVAVYESDYNTVRLYGAIGSVTPWDQLLEHAEAMFAERRRRLTATAARRAAARENPNAAAA